MVERRRDPEPIVEQPISERPFAKESGIPKVEPPAALGQVPALKVEPKPDPFVIAAELRTRLEVLDRNIEEQETKYKRRVALGSSPGTMQRDIEEMKKSREVIKKELEAAEASLATISKP